MANNVQPANGILFPTVLAIADKAPHPAAARLLIDFMFGDDSPTGGPGLEPFNVPGDYAMATMFIRELSVSVVLSRPGSEVLAVRILNFADDGLWGKLSALGIIMILLSTGLVLLATYAGNRFKRG